MMTVSMVAALEGTLVFEFQKRSGVYEAPCALDQFRGTACDVGNPEMPQHASILFNLLKPTGCVHQQV
jgi:hypothetical protein